MPNATPCFVGMAWVIFHIAVIKPHYGHEYGNCLSVVNFHFEPDWANSSIVEKCRLQLFIVHSSVRYFLDAGYKFVYIVLPDVFSKNSRKSSFAINCFLNAERFLGNPLPGIKNLVIKISMDRTEVDYFGTGTIYFSCKRVLVWIIFILCHFCALGAGSTE